MIDKRVADALRLLKAENAATAPPDVQAKVMAEFDARKAPGRLRWLPPMVLAASLAAAAIFMMHRPAHRSGQVDASFVAIPYVAPPAPYERTEVKRMDVPLGALIAAGIKVPATVSKGTVEADVLVGQDGRPLAIRLI